MPLGLKPRVGLDVDVVMGVVMSGRTGGSAKMQTRRSGALVRVKTCVVQAGSIVGWALLSGGAGLRRKGGTLRVA